MLAWLSENIATIVICAILVVMVVAIVAGLIRDKKKGRSSCGGNCGHCPMGGQCHSAQGGGPKGTTPPKK